MKTPCLLLLSIASMFFAPFAAHSATDTWDGGGGANDNFSTNANWVDNTAPVSNLSTTDLVFDMDLFPDGTGDASALVDTASFSTHSLTFGFNDPNLLSFGIDGGQLNVGTGGIVENSAVFLVFHDLVSFSGVANATINMANTTSQGMSFYNTVALPTATLTVTGGGHTQFTDFSGAGLIFKTGAGRMLLSSTANVSQDITVGAGTLQIGKVLNPPAVFSSTSSLAITNTSTLEMWNVTLDGAHLTRASGAILTLFAGKTLTVQNGADVVITGSHSHNTDSSVVVTGAGSTFSASATLGFNIGTATVSAGAAVSADVLNVGGGGNTASMTVTGSGSSVNAGNLNLGLVGGHGTLVFSSGSTGTFTQISVDNATPSVGEGHINIESGSAVTGTGLEIGNSAYANTDTVTINGSNSTLTLSGAATATIGAASASSARLEMDSRGDFQSGTGLTTVNATGTIAINGGGYIGNGDLKLVGGQLTRDATGLFSLLAGTTFTIQSGGDANFSGAYSNNSASTILVTGAGSTFSTTSTLAINGGSSFTAALGADVSAGAGAVNVGFSGNGTVAVNNPGTSLSGGSLSVGGSGNTGSVTFSSGSTGGFGAINVDSSVTAGTSGLLLIQNGAIVTGTGLSLAPTTVINSGTITITGTNSALTLSGAATATIGGASGSTGTLNVQSGGIFNTGTGLTTVRATGLIAIAGGTFNANGNLTLNAGQLTRDAAGTFALGAGKTFTVQSGGGATITGAYTDTTASTILVTGVGSMLSASGALGMQAGSTLNVAAGGSVSSALAVNVGTSGGNGTVTVDGAGTSLSGSSVHVAQSGNAGSLTFTNGSIGTLGSINVDVTSTEGSNGTLNISSGATVTGSNFTLATGNAVNYGTIFISGAGSALTITGGGTSAIGAASGSTGILNVQSGATFTTGTGITTVNPTGLLNIGTGATLMGASTYGGTGPITIAGAYLPGTASGPNQTASVSFAQNMAFQSTTSITMEIGGLVAGTDYDHLVFNGPGTPHVTWNGTLNINFIRGFTPQAGQIFDLFDFDAARASGAFTAINLPPLGAGLFWRTDQLYVNGTIQVDSLSPSPTPTLTPTPTSTPSATSTPTPSSTPTGVTISGTVSYCTNPVPGPVPNVTMTLTGSASGSTLSDGSGNYTFSGLAPGGNYTVTPTKAARAPGTGNINTTDVIATQRHFLNLGTPLSGCRLLAADVNGDTSVNTTDVIAIQRFFLGLSTGIANTGKYKFTPVNRTYTAVTSNQTGQNYDTLVFGDTAAAFSELPDSLSQTAPDDGTTADEAPAPVAAVALPEVAVDQSMTNFIIAVETSAIDAKNKLVGFQADFTFDAAVVSFATPEVEAAGLTATSWNVSSNILNTGPGTLKTLRISAFSLDFTPLKGFGTLFNLRILRMSNNPTDAMSPLVWAEAPDNFVFIDDNLESHTPTQANGLIAITGATTRSTPDPAVSPSLSPPPSSRAPGVTSNSLPPPTLSPTLVTQAINLSTRMRVQTGDNVGIGGFIIAGSAPKHVLLRAIGPSLTDFGVPDFLADPVLELHGPGAFATITNDNWRDTQEDKIQASGIPPTDELQSAIDATLAPGAYTAIVRDKNNTSGVALVEVYDLNQRVDSKVANLSTRAFVSTGDDIVIAGFLLSDSAGEDRIVVRGIGPSLAPGSFPASAVLYDPTLELRDSNGTLLIANNDWQDSAVQAAKITAAGLAPTNPREAAIAATLPPGLYTALLAGLNNGTGIGVVEVYDIGP